MSKANTSGSSVSLMKSIEFQLLKLLQQECEPESDGEVKPLSEDLLSGLHFVFGNPLLQAFDLIDNEKVTKFVSPSGRIAFQVKGSSGKFYSHLPSSNFCACPYYSFTVLKKKEAPMCKHSLAVLLSCTMKKYKEIQVSDEDLSQLILGNTDVASDGD